MFPFYRLFLIFLFTLSVAFIGCNKIPVQDSTKNNTKPLIQSNKERLTKTHRETESLEAEETINSNNAIEFLTAYGKENTENTVVLKTMFGNIKMKLYEETYLHRANFIFLAKEGYFDTTCFYRVVPDFIIQAGDSENLTTQRMRNQFENYKLPAEFYPELKHKYGAVAAARDWVNNPLKKSTPFEFYIIQNKQGGHHLDGEHTVFGQVISGFKTIDKIANLKAGGDEWPLLDVYFKVEVIE